MKTYSLMSIGKAQYTRLGRVQLVMHRYAPLSTCYAEIQDPDGSLFEKITADEPVAFAMGYRVGLSLKWEGTIRTTEKHEDRLHIYCVGPEKIFEQKVQQVWLNEQPERIIEQLVGYTGFGIGQIQRTGLTLPRFVVKNRAIWEAEKQLQQTMETYGVDTSKVAFWIGANGLIQWGTHDEAGDVEIVSGENMIAYRRNEIEALLTPNLRASQKVHIIAPGMDKVSRAVRVLHTVGKKTRTFVQLEE